VRPTESGTAPGTTLFSATAPGVTGSGTPGSSTEDTLELCFPKELIPLLGDGPKLPPARHPGDGELLDRVPDWGPTTTPAGVFQLVPVRIERDLALISRWMNDPAVAAFWGLSGSEETTAAHLRPQLKGDGRSVPCLGVLDGTPMSYWEIYRADLDPIARHYPARPHDTGIHLLIGGVANRGRGIGTTLLRAVAELVLDQRPHCARVVAEPDLRNTPSIAAFRNAGFRFAAEVDLPAKRAALMIRDRELRTSSAAPIARCSPAPLSRISFPSRARGFSDRADTVRDPGDKPSGLPLTRSDHPVVSAAT
jgi:RimJ/RimL family protein N-acetyltransferase